MIHFYYFVHEGAPTKFEHYDPKVGLLFAIVFMLSFYYIVIINIYRLQ